MPWESGTWTAYEVCNGTITQLMSCSNDNTNGFYGVAILIALWAIMFFSLSRDMEKGLAASSLITTIVALLMAATDPPIVDYPIALGFVVLTVVSVMLLYGSRGNNA